MGPEKALAGGPLIRAWHLIYDQEASAHGYTLRLVGLDPYPKEGQTIDPADYVATVVLTAGSTAPDM